MSEKLKVTRAQMRSAAVIAKEEGVRITLAADGTLSVHPVTAAEATKLSAENNGIIRL